MDHFDCSRSCFGYNILINYVWHCHNDLSVLQKVSVQIQHNNCHDSVTDYRSSRCRPSQAPVTVNSYTSNHETVDEKDDQQQNTMEPYYDQPEKIMVSLAHTIIIVDA